MATQLTTNVSDKSSSIASNRILVPIKQSGSKLPIFMVHCGSLNIWKYKSLSQFLKDEQPLYGLLGLGLDGDMTCLSSLESIAARYLREVVEQEPDGPYIIMGYSFGGIIAYEMARQLLEAGKKVKMLGILDANVSDKATPARGLSKIGKGLKRQMKKLVFFAGSFLKYPGETWNYQWIVVRRKLRKLNKSAKRKILKENQAHQFSNIIIDAYDQAYYKYAMQPVDIRIDLFRVKKRLYYGDDPKYMGWRKYALQGVRIHEVPGDHETCIKPPNNNALAEIIQRRVEE